MTTETSGSHDTESGDKESRDPIHIGEQCSTATCGTVDFLPITCSFCNSVGTFPFIVMYYTMYLCLFQLIIILIINIAD